MIHNFCPNGSGYRTETNSERVYMDVASGRFDFMNKYAYSLNTIDKPQIMNQLLSWSEKHKVYGLGQWREHQHYNSDVTVELAMDMCDRLIK